MDDLSRLHLASAAREVIACRLTLSPPCSPLGLLPTHYAFLAGKGVVRITARKARELGMRVGPEPVEGNPHHGGIWAPNPAISISPIVAEVTSPISRCDEEV